MERRREQLHAPARADDVAIAVGVPRRAGERVDGRRRESFVVLALDEQRAQRVRLLLTVGSGGQCSEPPWAHAAAKGWWLCR
jgi:hypothetical protein